MTDVARHIDGTAFTASFVCSILRAALESGNGGIEPLDAARHELLAVKRLSYPSSVVATGQSQSCTIRAHCLVRTTGPWGKRQSKYALREPLYGTAFHDKDHDKDHDEIDADGHFHHNTTSLYSDQSTSLLTVDVYVKRVDMSLSSPEKPVDKVLRDVLSCRNECNFYVSTAPTLRKVPGVEIPALLHMERRDATDGGSGQNLDRATLLSSAFLLVLSRVPRDRYCQHSPLTMKEAKASARMPISAALALI